MKNVLVIGSGKRVMAGILPALMCLSDSFHIKAVYARKEKILTLGTLNLTTKTDFEAIGMSDIDLIMIAITQNEVCGILKQLSKYNTKHIVLMLDTPVMPLKNIRSAKYFENFKRALVSEDTITLPPFLLARKLIDEGKIGAVQKIEFLNNGYKYHALASLKMLAQEKNIQSIRSKKVNSQETLKVIKFPGGIMANILEPRDYTKGKFSIHGEKGIIADYEINGGNVYQIGYKVKDSIYQGLTLNSEEIAPSQIDLAYLSKIPNNLPDKSLTNSMKVRGLMDLILAFDKDYSQFQYKPLMGVYDKLAINISEYGYFRDIGLTQILKLLM